MTPNYVEQGRTFAFGFEIPGTGGESFTTTYAVMQYPGDTPALSGSMSYSSTDGEYIAALTGTNTASLSVGQWFIHAKGVDADEDLAKPIKIYVRKGWA